MKYYQQYVITTTTTTTKFNNSKHSTLYFLKEVGIQYTQGIIQKVVNYYWFLSHTNERVAGITQARSLIDPPS